MPSVNISDEDRRRVEELRIEMTLIMKKVPSTKTAISLVLEFAYENKADFSKWLDRGSRQK
ncbi:MAG: hypothetical protein ABSA79_02625 [Candidatus Bathyarchaeia archaeon]